MNNPWFARSLTVILVLVLAACGSATPPPATLPPTFTPTPKSTALPTVGTSAPLGSSERPYQVVIMLPQDSTASGTSLETFLNDRTGFAFRVEAISSTDPNRPDPLDTLCGGTPTFGWVDGWTMLAAQALGCAAPVLKFQRNLEEGNSTGVRSDLLVRSVNRITAVSALRERVFCRLNSQDTASWILPVIMLRGGGVGPHELDSVRDFPDYGAMLQALADGVCGVAALPSGTLANYLVTDRTGQADITRIINVLATSPEIPYGGLVISSTVPRDTASLVTRLFVEHPDELQGLIAADELVSTSAGDFAEVERFIQAGGVDLRALGQ